MTARPRRVLVLGGGTSGLRQARIAARAVARGALVAGEVWALDRDPECPAARAAAGPGWRCVTADWEEFLASYLAAWPEGAGSREGDLIVLSSAAPDLFARWLARALAARARLEEVPPPFLPELPLAEPRGTGLALSLADWPCPADCIEPATCPATRQPRGWDLAREMVFYARRLRAAGLVPLVGPLGGRVCHVGGGVRAQPLQDWAHAARRLREALAEEGAEHGGGCYVLAGTVSGCHGRAALWRATPASGVRARA